MDDEAIVKRTSARVDDEDQINNDQKRIKTIQSLMFHIVIVDG